MAPQYTIKNHSESMNCGQLFDSEPFLSGVPRLRSRALFSKNVT
jgi:hypothetical protein